MQFADIGGRCVQALSCHGFVISNPSEEVSHFTLLSLFVKSLIGLLSFFILINSGELVNENRSLQILIVHRNVMCGRVGDKIHLVLC